MNINFDLLDSISKDMIRQGLTVSVAESCTGGFVSTFFTSKSGASLFFKGGLINYTENSKIELLGVTKKSIQAHGVVSKEVVEKMAINIRSIYNSDYGLATTGYIDLYVKEFGAVEKSNNFYAWIGVASNDMVVSNCIILNKKRLENISTVSYALLNLFRKEIS